MSEAVYTIGHSTHASSRLLELLEQHAITAVCDVRSQPYSRTNPQFNREPLRDALRAAGIRYVFLGKELGARSDDKTCYRNGRVQYDRLARTDAFKRGLERVREGSNKYRVALMCAERDPLQCHRTILVARELVEQGLPVRHILANGRIEEHEQALSRLLETLKLRQDDMFRSRQDSVAEAYRIQSEAIAYQEKSADTPTPERHQGAQL